MNRNYLQKFNLSSYYLNPNNWEEIFINDWSDDEKTVFFEKKQAIDLFLLTDLKMSEISQKTHISRREIYRLLERCLTLDEYNQVFGYRALIPNIRVKKYMTTKYETVNQAGVFSKLLKDYPQLEEFIISEYFNTNKHVREKKQSIRTIHSKFIKKCIDIGINEDQYPLNMTSLGKKSLQRFLRNLSNKNLKLSSKLNGEEADKLLKNVNNTVNSNTFLLRPFERIEFDAHKIDNIFSLITYTPKGDKIVNILNRIWLLCMVDVASRAVIGYHISFNNNNYSANDVIRCFKNALTPWKPKKLTIPGLKYNEGDTFPSNSIDDTKFALWDEICLDNAKAHQAQIVLNGLLEDVKCSINFGPVGTPTRRPIIERFFLTLENNNFHRLPSTTGSNVLDPKRDNPELKSIFYEVSIDHLEEIMDVVLAKYNNTPHSANDGFTPLEVIKNRINRGMYIRKLPLNHRNIDFLFPTVVQVRVNGNLREGRSPYINFKYVRYTSPKLCTDFDMVNSRLKLIINTDNIQTVKAYRTDGSYYDTLVAQGVWGKVPHSLLMRVQIMSHKNKREFDYAKHDDPILAYQDFLATKSYTNKKARAVLQEYERYKKEHNISKQLEIKESEAKKDQIKKENIQHQIIERSLEESKETKISEIKNNMENISSLENRNNTEKTNKKNTLASISSARTDQIKGEMGTDLVSDNIVRTVDKTEIHQRVIEKNKGKKGRSISF